MPKLFCTYYPVKCIECPSKFDYIKEFIYNQPLYIYESEHVDPGKHFFKFGQIRSTIFKSFENNL